MSTDVVKHFMSQLSAFTEQQQNKQNLDDWGRTVLDRINKIFDLHAAKAINHEDFYEKFYFVKPLSGRKRGRPQEELWTISVW